MKLRIAALALMLTICSGVANAQWAVYDAANWTSNFQQVAKMVSQLQKMQQQIETARNQLNQAKQQYQAITGSRGMSLLTTDTNRLYIPKSWKETLNGGNSEIGKLADQIRKTAGYLEDRNLEGLNQYYKDALRKRGDQAANDMAASATVFEESGERFERLQRLMDTIESASDDKAIQDLQARIQVEQVMLQNELVRAQAMNATIQQQQQVERERQRQRASSHSFKY